MTEVENNLELTECQKRGLELLRSGENVFLTGGAGSGKSFLVRHFLKECDKKTFPVLASTGAAAILVGGRTFHSFFGLGILEGSRDSVVERALKDRRVVRRLKDAEGVLVDEISMISGAAFEVAEEIARVARGKDLPWGGLRVIVVGDFAQLPPVSKMKSMPDWVFRNFIWDRTDLVTVNLNTIVRMQDQDFIKVLNCVRCGELDDDARQFLNGRIFEDLQDFNGTRMFARRDSTEHFNLKRLSEIDGEVVEIPTQYSGAERLVQSLKQQAPIPEVLQLKIGALVMLRQNDPRGRWVNGSLGHVGRIRKEEIEIELLSGRSIEISRSTFSILDGEGKVSACAVNFPLMLAYATTIHKSQGATLDRVHVDLRGLWEVGQAYVAMSRVRMGQDLSLVGWSENDIRVDSNVSRFYSQY